MGSREAMSLVVSTRGSASESHQLQEGFGDGKHVVPSPVTVILDTGLLIDGMPSANKVYSLGRREEHGKWTEKHSITL